MAITQTLIPQPHKSKMVVLKALVTHDDDAAELSGFSGNGYVERIQVTMGGTTPDSNSTITLVDAQGLDAAAGNLTGFDGTAGNLDFLTADLHVPINGPLTIGEAAATFGNAAATATVYIYIATY